jgi:hypothetical protein
MYNVCQSAVKIENKHSNYFNLEKGEEQGGSLSPTLFNCFINDIHDIFDQSCDSIKLDHTLVSSLSFSDDLVIFSESHKGLQNALYKLQKILF